MLKGGGPRATHSDARRKRLDEAMSNEAKVQDSKRKINAYFDRHLEKESERIEKDLESKKTKHASEEEKPQPRGGKRKDDEEETEAKRAGFQKKGDKRKADDDEAFFEACKRALQDNNCDNPSSSSTAHRPQKRERDRGTKEEGEAEKKIRAEVNGLAVNEEEVYLDEQAWDDVRLGEELDIEKVKAARAPRT